MKQIKTLALALTTALTLTACGGGGVSGGSNTPTPPTPIPTTSPVPTPTQQPSGLIGDYIVTSPDLTARITGATKATNNASQQAQINATTVTALATGVAGANQLPQQVNGKYFIKASPLDGGAVAIAVSTDGANFAPVLGLDGSTLASSLHSNTNINSVAFFSGKYVSYTVAGNNTFTPAYSLDGTNWQYGASVAVAGATLSNCSNLAQANGVLIVGCSNSASAVTGQVFYSYDGVNWRTKNLPNIALTNVTSDGSTLYAESNVADTNAYTSTDGLNWQVNPTTNAVNSVANGKYFSCTGVGDSASGALTTYTGGLNVTAYHPACVSGVSYSGGKYVATYRYYSNGTTTTYMVQSTNGINWASVHDTISTIVVSNWFAPIGTYVAGVLYYSTESAIVKATSGGANWQWEQMVSNFVGTSAVQVGGVATVVGATKTYMGMDVKGVPQYSYKQAILSQRANGTATYASIPASTGTLAGVAYGNGVYVAVGSAGTVLVSSDGGATYSAVSVGAVSNIMQVSFNNGMFTAVTSGNILLISTNGINWAVNVISGAPHVATNSDYTYSGALIVGCSGMVGLSTNNVSWMFSTAATTANLYAATSNGASTYVAVGQGGVVVRSVDAGRTWQVVNSGVASDLLSVTYSSTAQQFVAVGADGAAIASTDGATWVSVDMGAVSLLNVTAAQ